MMFFIEMHMSLPNFVASEPKTKEIWLFLCLLLLKPRSCIADLWHACSHCSIAPVAMYFNHNVSHILAHVSRNSAAIGFKIKEISYFLYLMFLLPTATLQPVGACAPENSLLHLWNPFTHMATYILWTCTYLYKLVWSFMPWWSRYWCHNNCLPCCPEIRHATRFVFIFPG